MIEISEDLIFRRLKYKYTRSSLKIVHKRNYVSPLATTKLPDKLGSLHAWGRDACRISVVHRLNIDARAVREIGDKLWHNLSNSTKSLDTKKETVDLVPFRIVSDSFFLSGKSYLYDLTKKKEEGTEKEDLITGPLLIKTPTDTLVVIYR